MLRVFSLFIVVTAFGQTTQPESGAEDQVMAHVEGVPVLAGEVMARATPEITRLELEALAQQAKRTKASYDQVDLHLTLTIAERLVAHEAKVRGVTVEDLYAAEVTPAVQDPDNDSIRAYYDANKARIGKPLPEVSKEIAALLKSQRWGFQRRIFVEGLWEKYEVKKYLQPYRVSLNTTGHPGIGPPDAPVVLVVFSDFQCRYCHQLSLVLKQVTSQYGNQVRLVYRQFPVAAVHPQAQAAAEASLCAAEQGRFWGMHDKLFEQPSSLSGEALQAKAEAAGLDTRRFAECMETSRYAAAVDRSIREGIGAGVDATPALFINGRPLGNPSAEKIAAIIDEELAASAK